MHRLAGAEWKDKMAKLEPWPRDEDGAAFAAEDEGAAGSPAGGRMSTAGGKGVRQEMKELSGKVDDLMVMMKEMKEFIDGLKSGKSGKGFVSAR